jgi:hypothetical protein
MRFIIAALLVGLTGTTCGEPEAAQAPSAEKRCADLCWGSEEPWDCLDACISDDDDRAEMGVLDT